MKTWIFVVLILIFSQSIFSQKPPNTFTFQNSDFLINGKPLQIISGEIHPNRVPAEYWQHRIKMAKAMGCNTIAAYIFWNYHEQSQGHYDFSTWNRDIAKFVKLAQDEGMWVILRPGPYVCAEWDFGGLPNYLLSIPDIKVRCMDSRYMKAATDYIHELAKVIKPLQINEGGPVIMLQVENEYGSYGNDREYMATLEKTWRNNGITIPFFTGDGPTPYMLEAGSLPGCASGLDSGSDMACFELAYKMNPGVPVFSSETYPGWLTHWGEKWARPDTAQLYQEIRFLMDNKLSFNFYVIHGGTNFGFTAGANSGGKGFEPDLTSYDYDSPINEQGLPTQKYWELRRIIGSYLPKGTTLPTVPAPIAAIAIPEVNLKAYTSLWNNLPQSISEPQPKPFEAYGQNQGYMLYKTELIGHKKGTLKITELHDYATIFLNGKYIGKLDRREKENSISIPASDVANPILEILVEGMGHINFAAELIDRKGITERVTLNGMTLMNWQVFPLPFDEQYISTLKSTPERTYKQGLFFKGTFALQKAGDTFFDMSNYTKGVVWINGHNLGRYWEIGPQNRLYCPACWLKKGENEVIVFDSHQLEAMPIQGYKTPE